MKFISEEFLDQTALTLKDKNLSYRELVKNSLKLKELIPSGTTKVAIYSENRFEWVYSLYASWASQALFVPIDFMSGEDDLHYILQDGDIDCLIYSNETAEKAKSVILRLKNERQKIVKGIHLDQIKSLSINCTDDELTEQIDEYWSLTRPELERIALVIYTSGTTGGPKGVMLTFNNIKANVEAITHEVPIFGKNDVCLALLPFHHIFPIMGTIIIPLYVGAKVAFSPSLTADDMMETLKEKGVTIFIGVPRLYRLLYNGIKKKIDSSLVARTLYLIAEKVDSYSFSKKIFKSVHQKFGGKIKVMVTGGAATDPEIMKFFKTLGFDILEGYGMSETAPMISFTRPGKLVIGSAGEVTPGMEVKIVDGEITVRGPNVMKGYLGKEEETAKVIKEGWLYTGDLGRIDEQGNLFVTGRKKDIIVLSSGKNINPEELEFKIIKGSPYVEDVAIFYHQDQIWAMIKPNMPLMEKDGLYHLETHFQEILDKVNSQNTPYKRVTRLYIIKDEIPRTRLGKIKRFQLPQIVEIGKRDSLSSKKKERIESFQELEILIHYLKEECNQNVSADDHLEIDLSLDSLAKVNLEAFILSTFGVKTGMEIFFQYGKVLDLAKYVQEHKEKIEIKKVDWQQIFQEKVDVTLPRSTLVHDLLTLIMKIFFNFYFKFEVEGNKQLGLVPGPVIFIANHQSYFDGAFLMVAFKRKLLKETFFYAKEKHVKGLLTSYLAKNSNIITTDLNQNLKLSLQKLATVLKNGKNVVIFPEGTRSKDGNSGDFKRSFAILSKELNVPILPVVISGAYKAMPTGHLPKPFKKIKIKFLAPVNPTAFSNWDLLKDSIQDQIKKNIE